MNYEITIQLYPEKDIGILDIFDALDTTKRMLSEKDYLERLTCAIPLTASGVIVGRIKINEELQQLLLTKSKAKTD